ncbi:hypothetical protein HPB48_009535 [Haemaphysalis longicornis]|uniref:Deltamethrin resistance protein prag01 domain-containing protein n=1 Tax=Haemaphysalis longicornis TaxID=44386 RepID=A0A9J6GDL1_HAELO|nr:hypothetical protein HPB48_009535 [Haemaphysalis longicornis]
MIAHVVSRRALLCALKPRSVARSYHPPAEHKAFTMADLPTFVGPWEEHFNKRQAKFNMHLAFGLGFFLATFATAVSLGTLDYVDTPPLKN